MDFSKLKDDLLNLKEPEILIVDEIGRNEYVYVAKALKFLTARDSPDVKIIIDSNGGETVPGLDIYDAIRLYKGKKNGVVLSRAFSMGAIILQACDKRSCARHAGVLIHHISKKNINLDELQDEQKREKIINDMLKNQKRLYDILVARTGKEESVIKEVCAKDKEMSSEEALGFGLVDEII
jgi:ATP-dependent Clp protease, protease subunit